MARNAPPTESPTHPRPKLDKASYSLEDLAKILPVPVDRFLEAAQYGVVNLFVPVPDRANVFSVVVNAVDLRDPLVEIYELRRGSAPLDPKECAPISMAGRGIRGLLLSTYDCGHLLRGEPVRQHLFFGGISLREGGAWVKVVPQKPHLDSGSSLRRMVSYSWQDQTVPVTVKVEGRPVNASPSCLACYETSNDLRFMPGTGYPRPLGIDLNRGHVFTTPESIARFLDTIDTCAYVVDLIVNGDVVTDRPTYFSEKLKYLIDASEKYCKHAARGLLEARSNNDSQSTATNESSIREGQVSELVSSIREKVISYLQRDEFDELIKRSRKRATVKKRSKRDSSDGIVLAAADFILPVAIRQPPKSDNARLYNSYITPELLALMAGAKLFWGAPNINFADASTHPRRDDVEDFFRRLGFVGDAPKYAATLIRPEAAVDGSPGPTRMNQLFDGAERKRNGLLPDLVPSATACAEASHFGATATRKRPTRA